MKKNEFYTVKDIMEQTGYCRTKCYELVFKLNEKLKQQYPKIVTYSGRILKKYWDDQFEMNEGGITNEIK